MKKTYTITGEDIAILKKRVPHPCTIEKCSRAQTPGDYGYLGCGNEAHCDRLYAYRAYVNQAKDANLWELSQLLLHIDSVMAEKKKLDRKILEDTAKIGANYGTKILQLIADNLYDGKL